MGQGFYTAMVWGGIADLKEEQQDKFIELLYQVGNMEFQGDPTAGKWAVHSRSWYEAEEQWFGFIIASGSNLDVGADMSKVVFDAGRLKTEARVQWPNQTKAARLAYKEFTRQVKLHLKVRLPKGKLLVVNDFD